MKTDSIKSKSFEFSLRAIGLYKILLKNREFILSKQFLRSATSIGANVNEATAAISYREFTAKMSIASKEARESLYWIELLDAGNLVTCDLKEIKADNKQIVKILTSIVKTCQKKLNT